MARFRRRTRFRRRRRRRGRRSFGRRRFRRRRMVLDPERKLLSVAVQHSPTNTGLVTLINGSPQGIDLSDRQGMQDLCTSVMVKYEVVQNPIGAIPTLVRVAVILDRQPTGALPSVGQIWQGVGGAFAVLGSRVLEEALRFRVLWSRTHRVDIGDQARWHMVFKNIRNKTRYSTGNGNIADIVSGAIYFVSVSDQPAGTTVPIVLFFSTIRFVG